MAKIKRNIVRIKKDGNFSKAGLNKNERTYLDETRRYMQRFVSKSVVDQYIIALYDCEKNEVFFTDENNYYNCDRAVLKS